MIPWIANTFGAGKTAEKGMDIAEKATDGIIAGVDKLWFTDEEKAEASQKIIDAQLEFTRMFAGENTEQSRARRELAKMVFKSYFALIFIMVGTWLIDKEFAAFVFTVIVQISGLTSAVAVAYFGPHQLSKIFQWKRK